MVGESVSKGWGSRSRTEKSGGYGIVKTLILSVTLLGARASEEVTGFKGDPKDRVLIQRD